MFGDNTKLRRKHAVYGRVKTSPVTYGLFDVEEPPVRGSSNDNSCEEKKRSLQAQHQRQCLVATSIEQSPKTKASTIRRPRFPARLKNKKVPAERDFRLNRDEEHGYSTYDVPISDEEEDEALVEESVQKRRRLTPVRYGDSQRKDRDALPIQLGSKVHSGHRSGNLRTGRHAPPVTRKMASPLQEMTPPRPRTPLEIAGVTALASPHNTKKQNRWSPDVLDGRHSFDSPSKLLLNSLNLATTQSLPTEVCRPDSDPVNHIDRQEPCLLPPKRRLIDAMACPRKRSSISALSGSSSDDSISGFDEAVSDKIDDSKDESQQTVATNVTGSTEEGESKSVAINGPSTSLNLPFKPRTTYSRERSHLAEMVSEDILDPLAAPVPGHDEHVFMSQSSEHLSSLEPSTSYTAVDEDDEQDVAGMRSIHELRQSGSNARSRVDIESILDDIEATGGLSRARRIHGLAQLVARLDRADIGQQILEHSIDRRLLRCQPLEGDTLGRTLLTMAFSRLLVTVQLPASSLHGIFQGLIHFGGDLLGKSTGLTSIVQSQKQNLSKATRKSIMELVGPFCSSIVWPSRKPTMISPQLSFVRFLEIVLRQARQAGDFDLVLPASTFSRLVDLLLQGEDILIRRESKNDSALVLEMIVSVIESFTISRNWVGPDCLEVAKGLWRVGPLLESLSLPTSEDLARTHHLILRLILNITNNSPELCDAFAKPAMISAIFGTVHTEYVQVAGGANVVLEDCRLEGVLLALGALSNLAEHSQLFRRAMLDSFAAGKSMVDWITFAFCEHVEQVSEVSSIEQSSSLVAFGYLSVLLCNLCMDERIRVRVRSSLTGRSLDPLLSFTQEFLDHFRKAEENEASEVEGEQQVKSGFVSRFEGILATLRRAEADC